MNNISTLLKPAYKYRLLLPVSILFSAQALSTATQSAPIDNKFKRIVVWDGEAHDKGDGWVNPATSTLLRTHDDSHSGNTALELKFDDKQTWIGWGFDWFNWKTGRTVGTATRKMTNLDFWIKADGLTQDLQVQLLCNGDAVDTPEHHAPKMSVARYCPSFADGKWHEVVIPLRDMDYPKGYDPNVVTMIDFGFYAQDEAKGAVFIDDIAFDNRPLRK